MTIDSLTSELDYRSRYPRGVWTSAPSQMIVNQRQISRVVRACS